MLPLGPVEFAWSSVIEDLYVTFTERRPTPTTAEEVEDLLDASDYKNTDLATAIRYGNEIMFNCDKYFTTYWQASHHRGASRQICDANRSRLLT